MAIEQFVKHIEGLQMRQKTHCANSLSNTEKCGYSSTFARCNDLSDDLVKLKDLLQSAIDVHQTSR